MFNHQKIEEKWQKIWEKEKIYEPNLKTAKKPFYNLMMFPYPSAEGLHVGNMYAFTGSDIYGRFKRIQGYDVFEPIGLDGFGIHSENYALKIGAHPAKQAKISEKRFYNQLKMIGNGFAWNERLETYDPEYYKWTQWIFVQMFKKGLAFRKKQAVNWCPSCKTVLADEQVINGKCERCSSKVIKRELEQWFFRITKYAEKLLRNLKRIDWSEKVKISQRNWIGRSEGSIIKFKIKFQQPKLEIGNWKLEIPVFTTRADTLFGATYMVLAPEHKIIFNLLPTGDLPKGDKSQILNFQEVQNYIKKAKAKSEEERIADGRVKTGIKLKGISAINPANKKEIPVWVADYVLASYGTGAIMAVPAHDSRDFAFAKKYKLPIIEVIVPRIDADSNADKREYQIASPSARNDIKDSHCEEAESRRSNPKEAYEGEGILVNSGKFTGISSEKAKSAITKFVGGKKKVQYRLRDWLISRQRYWGPPIPMIYCKECAAKDRGERKEMPGWIAVPEKDLPVKLPFIKDFRPKGKGASPLASVRAFYETKCPKCRAKARRETDVSDTFLDSAWYYLGYLILGNKKRPSGDSSKIKIKNKKFNLDKNLIKKWLPVDMYIGGAEHAVLHLLYSRFLTMVFYDLGLLHFEEPFTKFRAHGLLIKEGAKMSKSKGNILNPDDYIKKFGADVFRIYLMFLAPFEQGGDFRDAGILGIKRFLEKVWKLNFNINIRTSDVLRTSDVQKLEKLLHQTIKKITEDIENLRYNTAISALMILFNEMEKNPQQCNNETMKQFLKLLAPFAPHLSEELWQQLTQINVDRYEYEIASPLARNDSRDCHCEEAESRRSNLKKRIDQRQSAFKSIHQEPWPKYDPKLIKEDKFELVIQINGKIRDKVSVKTDIFQKEAQEIAFSREKIKNWLKGKKIKKIVFVSNRLINIVI